MCAVLGALYANGLGVETDSEKVCAVCFVCCVLCACGVGLDRQRECVCM